MRILLDHNLDWRISSSFPDHKVSTTLEMKWDTLKNGALLTEADKHGLEVLLTSDKGIKDQQSMQGRTISVIILRAQITDLARILN